MQEDTWPRVAVLGAGAVGCYFGGMLARAGAPVTLIGRPQHVEAMSRGGLLLESMRFQQQVPVSASTDVAAAGDAAVVLLCVKTLNTEEAAKSLAPHLAPGAVVVSLQNGVDNVERIRSAAKIEAVSTAQDIARGKRTEIDSLNGYVVRRGTELGVMTPVNMTLHALVKFLEEAP